MGEKFPLFISLEGKKCVVVGGGNVATRRIETLLAFEAAVEVISPMVSPVIAEWHQMGKVILHERCYEAGDLEGAFLVVAATGDRGTNSLVAQEAALKKIHANIADAPGECTFFFPAIAKKNEAVVGISTSGQNPGVSRMIRGKVEYLLNSIEPEEWEQHRRRPDKTDNPAVRQCEKEL